MLTPFKLHIERQLPLLQNAKLLIACSGGLDSVVLTYLLKELNFSIVLAHCNFSLRGAESDGDATFVEELAEKLDIPFYIKKFDTGVFASEQKLSTQMAARQLRYDWFNVLLKEIEFDYILTAHHADDDLETFLINLSRGTGLRGLTGIQEKNEYVVRPLLPFSRADIFSYAKSHELYWREDSSNSKSNYLRNDLRINVIPSYKEAVKNVLSSFTKTQKRLSDSQALVEDYVVLVQNLVMTETNDGFEIDIQKISELSNTSALLYEILHPFGFRAWNDISELLSGQSGKQVFSTSHRLLKDRGVLLLTPRLDDLVEHAIYISEDTSEIHLPVRLQFKTAKRFEITNAHTVFVDNEMLRYPLQLRRWKEGDVFQPFGMEGKKKLSKFFKDEKLSLVAKENIWVLCSNNKIVWVVGLRLDNRFKVSKDTQNIVRIDYTP
ncbi:MAG: tRNA lysidine(34) synthetase TilS [Flavobacteriaceae bacterium]|nr:tRNA lysidine(34) synthetase TilS [Flavobacteriaceae bacterium]